MQFRIAVAWLITTSGGRGDGRLDSSGTSSEPASDSTEQKSDRGGKGSGRNRARGGVGSLGSLLFGLLDRLTILLFVLLNLVAGFIDRNALCPRNGLGSPFPRVLRLRLITGHGSAHGRDGCIAQCLRVVSAR